MGIALSKFILTPQGGVKHNTMMRSKMLLIAKIYKPIIPALTI